jgi:hypothetical protein
LYILTLTVRNQKTSIILSFLRQLKVSTQPWRRSKLLVLGEVEEWGGVEMNEGGEEINYY